MSRGLVYILVSRSNHDGENGLAGTSMQDTTAVGWATAKETFRKSQSLSQPVHHNRLQLGNCRGADPVEMGAIEGVGVHFRNGGRVTA